MTDYLVDIQRIEELPVNLAEDIIDTAKEIERLDGNRSNISSQRICLQQSSIVRCSGWRMTFRIRSKT